MLLIGQMEHYYFYWNLWQRIEYCRKMCFSIPNLTRVVCKLGNNIVMLWVKWTTHVETRHCGCFNRQHRVYQSRKAGFTVICCKWSFLYMGDEPVVSDLVHPFDSRVNLMLVLPLSCLTAQSAFLGLIFCGLLYQQLFFPNLYCVLLLVNPRCVLPVLLIHRSPAHFYPA